jgi:hypothetical protein
LSAPKTFGFAQTGCRLSVTNVSAGAGATVEIWGGQIELGAFPTSYIPTTTAAVTRAADVASMTGTAFSSWFNATEGTFVAGVDTHGVQSSASRVLSVDGGSAVDSYTLLRSTSSPALRAVLTLNSSSQYDNDAASGSFTLTGSGNKFSAAISSGLGTDAFCGNGGAVFTTAAKGVALSTRTMTGLYLGANRIGTSYLNGHLRSLVFYNKRLPDATLKALSA